MILLISAITHMREHKIGICLLGAAFSRDWLYRVAVFIAVENRSHRKSLLSELLYQWIRTKYICSWSGAHYLC